MRGLPYASLFSQWTDRLWDAVRWAAWLQMQLALGRLVKVSSRTGLPNTQNGTRRNCRPCEVTSEGCSARTRAASTSASKVTYIFSRLTFPSKKSLLTADIENHYKSLLNDESYNLIHTYRWSDFGPRLASIHTPSIPDPPGGPRHTRNGRLAKRWVADSSASVSTPFLSDKLYSKDFDTDASKGSQTYLQYVEYICQQFFTVKHLPFRSWNTLNACTSSTYRL